MRLLLQGIRDIDRQLGDSSVQRSDEWRPRAIRSKVYKQTEYDFLKEEVQDLRRLHAAREADVYEENDPRHLLLRLREEIARSNRNEENQLNQVCAVVDRYFEHDGGDPDGSRKPT